MADITPDLLKTLIPVNPITNKRKLMENGLCGPASTEEVLVA